MHLLLKGENSMKRKLYIILALAAAALCIFLVTFKGRPFKDITAGDLDKVVFYYPGDRETEVTEPEDLEKVVQLLQAMRLRRTFLPRGITGCGIMMDIYYSDGTIQKMSFTSDYVASGGKWYACSRYYGEDFRRLCEELW